MQASGFDLILMNSTTSRIKTIASNFQTVFAEDLNSEHFHNVIISNAKQHCPGVLLDFQHVGTYHLLSTCHGLSWTGDYEDTVVISNMTCSIIRHLKWSFIVIFYEESTGNNTYKHECSLSLTPILMSELKMYQYWF